MITLPQVFSGTPCNLFRLKVLSCESQGSGPMGTYIDTFCSSLEPA